MSSLSLNLLGSFEARLDGHPLSNLGVKAQALLIYLSVEQRPQRREQLLTLLWPRMPEKSARHNLSQAIYTLRQVFPQDAEAALLLADRQTIQLNPTATYAVDLQQFDSLLITTQTHIHPDLAACPTCIEALGQAINLYQGDFISDFYFEDSNEFNEWAEAIRETYRRKLMEAISTLAEIAIQNKDYEKALIYIERQLNNNNLSERTHRQKMKVLALEGRRVEAIRQYRECTQLLTEQLGVEPTQETTALYERIQAEDLSAKRPSIDVESSKSTVTRNNLTRQATAFIGRKEELAQLDKMLHDPHIRLITIVAPGGMGKTRLAIAAAENQLAQANDEDEFLFPDGLYFVPLASISHPKHLLPTLAEGLQIDILAEEGNIGPPQQQVIDYLHHKRMLIVLDNFEQLLTPSANATDLLQQIWCNAPGVRLMVTSREPLRLYSEQIYPLNGLQIPAQSISSGRDDYDAARLFIQSARRIRPDYQLRHNQESKSLAQICHLVDGMPLALELAARWVDVLSLDEIATEIQRNLELLETELRDVPERHRGMRAVFDASWARLSEDEKTTLAHFSVFRSGCTRAAAQKVTGASLKTLARLTGKSLLMYEKETRRYRIHELLRQYAADKLSEQPAAETVVQRAYCAYYCESLEEWEKELKSARHVRALAAISADYENIRQAWEWALAHDELTYMSQAVDGLSEYFDASIVYFEARRMFEEAISQLLTKHSTSPASTPAARLLCRLYTQGSFGNLSPFGIVYDDAGDLYQKSLALLKSPALRGEDTRREEAAIIFRLSGVNKAVWPAESRMHLETSLRLYQELDDPVGIGDVYFALATYYTEQDGDYKNAQKYYTKSISLRQQTGDPQRIASCLNLLADINRFILQAYQEAYAAYEQAYEISKSAGLYIGMIRARKHAIWLAWFLGDFEQALTYCEEIMFLSRKTGRQYFVAANHGSIGLTLAYCGRFSLAKRMSQDGLEIDPRANNVEMKLVFAIVDIHEGNFDAVQPLATENTNKGNPYYHVWILRLLSWGALARGEYTTALAYAQKCMETPQDLEWTAWSSAPLGLAYFCLGRITEAKQTLLEALQSCVEIRAFLPLMHLLPVIPVVLAGEDDEQLKERAVEVYAAAQCIPFVGNSQLFRIICELHIYEAAMRLPPDIVQAAEARGRTQNPWDSAVALLEKLKGMDWNGLG